MNEPKNRLDTIFQYIDIGATKQLFQALKNTHRRSTSMHPHNTALYTNLTPRTFTGDMGKRGDIRHFVATTIKDLNHPKWKQHFNRQGFLHGTNDQDGNTRDHTKQQTRLRRKYGQYDVTAGAISQEDYELIYLAMLIHDVGEAARGDIVVNEKTDTAEAFEKKCGEVILQWIIKKEYQQGEKNIMPRIQEAYQINFDSKHRLHTFFKASECTSYINGALIASRKSDKDINKTYLIHNVLHNEIHKLIRFKKEVPSVAHFIADHKSGIDNLFAFFEHIDRNTLDEINGKSMAQYKDELYAVKKIRENEIEG